MVTPGAFSDPPATRVAWSKHHRLVLSHYPPIDLYDDVADPHDWEALAAAQARTNPRIYEQIGDLSLVPPERRISGDGASWVMAAFTHVSPDRRSRFADGSYGVYYAGESLVTALYEHSFHMSAFYARSAMPAGWLSEVRQLVGGIETAFLDLRGPGFERLLDADDYAASQVFAAQKRADGWNGLLYPSVRCEGGECIAAFWPDVVERTMPASHFRYFWNGQHITYAREITGERRVFELHPVV